MFAGPGAMLTVVLGQRKWYCELRHLADRDVRGAARSPLSADARIGPIWLENVGETLSAYASGSTSITLLKPGWAVGQW